MMRSLNPNRVEPPEEDPPIVKCDVCGLGFYEGDFIYEISGETLCET